MIYPVSPLRRAAAYGQTYRQKDRPLHPTATAEELRQLFCTPLPENPGNGIAVIDELIAAAEPGLVGNTDPNFYAWVMGGSEPVGVAADWLTSIWGQNGAIYQTSPAAAIAEEAVSDWLLDLLDLPRESSVGFVTGATMAGFVCLSAARTVILARAGHDFEKHGMQGAPLVRIFISDDAHASNFAALRHLGFGDANIVRIPSDHHGMMKTNGLAVALSAVEGPKIVIAQAGHINSGGFEDFRAISRLAKNHDAWLHVDGAFGLWARVLSEKASLTDGVDLADSWSVDGHKWLQIPYDSGFAIVRDRLAHRRSMDISAGYLNSSPEDGRNPTEYNPELSRRARGFAAWAVLRHLGRSGIASLVRGHCEAAALIARDLSGVPGLKVANRADLNQVVICSDGDETGDASADEMARLAQLLNDRHGVFVKEACWKGRTVLRLSVISPDLTPDDARHLVRSISIAWEELNTCDKDGKPDRQMYP